MGWHFIAQRRVPESSRRPDVLETPINRSLLGFAGWIRRGGTRSPDGDADVPAVKTADELMEEGPTIAIAETPTRRVSH
jgi:hypothetical protein